MKSDSDLREVGEMGKAPPSRIANAVAVLPEIYQPIYGYPELSVDVSRGCDDRLVHIEGVWRELGKVLGRAPSVLDLGCAQGYISLHLAALGAPVIGVDHFQENIAVCEALAAEHPEWQVQFAAANIERLFEYIDLTKIDLVLGLSVFHHMARIHGHGEVTKWITTLAAHVAVGIFELALADEPVHWASAQPADEREFLTGFTFTHEIARLPTHLSTITRPLIYASNTFWYLNGTMERFTSMTRSSHDPSVPTCGGTRRYFFNERHIAKVFSLRDAFPVLNRGEILYEMSFLAKPPDGFQPVPALLSFGTSEREAWIMRECLAGELLFDRIGSGKSYDAQNVIAGVLQQLAVLEQNGVYHNDVKTWNVLIMPDEKATLIDYGSISPHKESFSWPSNLFASFWVFVWCVATGSTWSGRTPAPPFASPHNLPEPYAAWARVVWKIAPSAWSFGLLRDTFDATMKVEQSANCSEPSADDLWRRGVETYISDLAHTVTVAYEEALKK